MLPIRAVLSSDTVFCKGIGKEAKVEITVLFATMWTGVLRINACFGSRCMVYFKCAQRALFIKHTQTQVIMILRVHVMYNKEKIHTWKGGPLLMVVNPHTSWSLAWSQLPLMSLAFPHPLHPLSRQKDIYLHTDDINMPTSSCRVKVRLGHSWGQPSLRSSETK